MSVVDTDHIVVVDYYTINGDCFGTASRWYWSNVRRNIENSAVPLWLRTRLMASGREIVSLQFGSYSNFIGTHWWNLQVSVTNFVPF
jgi:hypothetical protein